MNLLDFVDPKAIIPSLKVETKEDAIREIVESLKSAQSIPNDDADGILAAILKREELGSTGIGKGVAVPHTKHPSVGDLIATVALAPDGVDFASLDGEPVHILFLVVSPPDRPGEHLRALETITRHLRDENFCNFLRQSSTPDEIIELLKEADEGHFG